MRITLVRHMFIAMLLSSNFIVGGCGSRSTTLLLTSAEARPFPEEFPIEELSPLGAGPPSTVLAPRLLDPQTVAGRREREAISGMISELFELEAADRAYAPGSILHARVRPSDAVSETADPARGSLVLMAFATDREIAHRSQQPMEADRRDPASETAFGSGRSSRLWYGSCLVWVPGHAPTPPAPVLSWRLFNGPSQESLIEDLATLAGTLRGSDLTATAQPVPIADRIGGASDASRSERGRSPERPALVCEGDQPVIVFIPGFNNTFEQSVGHAAQLMARLRLDALAAVYSWPSKAELLAYLLDQDSARWTAPHLRRFLEHCAEKASNRPLHVIAHSTGAAALVEAIRGMKNTGNTPIFEHLVLAAADVDQDIFYHVNLDDVRRCSRHTTIYVNREDLALSIASWLRLRQPRLGQYSLGQGPFIARQGEGVAGRIETIDVTAVSSDPLGHAYFREDDEVISDLRMLLATGRSASDRGLSLVSPTRDRGAYWQVHKRRDMDAERLRTRLTPDRSEEDVHP
ncbi:MAG: alpha/beta hydrolase [Phycisphaerae bacterium]|nr:alpha/beta hydrolase [Phycisphaerae bacterium]